MLWISVEDCDGCRICVQECPVNTITMEEKAEIDMDESIRCGI